MLDDLKIKMNLLLCFATILYHFTFHFILVSIGNKQTQRHFKKGYGSILWPRGYGSILRSI